MAVTFAIDISHHQDKNLSLAAARGDGCELAILKAGEGSTFVDPDFTSNLAEARAAGQLVAAYWYQRSSATAAQHVAKIRQVVPLDVPIIPDVEAGSGGVQLTRDLVAQLRAAGYRVPLLYLPLWYWRDNLGSPALAGLPPLWSSRYPDNVVGTLASEWAAVPASYWNGYGGLGVALLQFTSSARIAGYQPLDASAFRGTRAELAALLNQEDDVALGGDDFKYLFYNNPVQEFGNYSQLLAEVVGKARASAGDAAAAKATSAAVQASVAALQGKVDALAAPAVDLDALAAKVAPAVAAAVQAGLASAVADELNRRLAS